MPGKNSGNKLYILTIDLEEWFHILDLESLADSANWDLFEVRIYRNAYRIIKVLQENKISATFFVLGWIAKKYPDLVKYISDQGHEIGTHSQHHLLIYKSKPELFKKDLIESIELIQSIINKEVIAFRAPGFSIKRDSLWVFKILADIGILYDSSIFPAIRGHGGISDFHFTTPFLLAVDGKIIKEFPINIFNIGKIKIPFSGGGYFRLFPFCLFKLFADNSEYIMTYFHPRDFDSSQPIIKELSILRKLKCYYGLNNSFRKFKQMLDGYNFINLTTASKLIQWGKTPVLYIDKLLNY